MPTKRYSTEQIEVELSRGYGFPWSVRSSGSSAPTFKAIGGGGCPDSATS